LKRVGVDDECGRQTDRQTDRQNGLYNSALSHSHTRVNKKKDV